MINYVSTEALTTARTHLHKISHSFKSFKLWFHVHVNTIWNSFFPRGQYEQRYCGFTYYFNIHAWANKELFWELKTWCSWFTVLKSRGIIYMFIDIKRSQRNATRYFYQNAINHAIISFNSYFKLIQLKYNMNQGIGFHLCFWIVLSHDHL